MDQGRDDDHDNVQDRLIDSVGCQCFDFISRIVVLLCDINEVYLILINYFE